MFWSGLVTVSPAQGQGLGGAGTIQGIVKDPTGGVMQSVDVRISNAVSGFTRTSSTDMLGHFAFSNLPPNPYHISVEAQGFQILERDVDVRSAVPITLDLTLALAGATTSVEVVGHADLLERDPTAHTDVDQSQIQRLPLETSGGLNQVVTLASPGVVAEPIGFFHPIGDHAQTQFSIDNQPITDQQSRLYSNQISSDAVQSLEIITGVAPAEYGDKSSLVVHIVTKSGLDQPRPSGSASFGFGSFNSPTGEASIAAARTPSATSSRSQACARIGSSIRRSSTRSTTRDTTCRCSIASTFTRATPTRCASTFRPRSPDSTCPTRTTRAPRISIRTSRR
jgi:hypothetical protein